MTINSEHLLHFEGALVGIHSKKLKINTFKKSQLTLSETILTLIHLNTHLHVQVSPITKTKAKCKYNPPTPNSFFSFFLSFPYSELSCNAFGLTFIKVCTPEYHSNS